ncbi:MAG: hypothetical protein ABIK28_02545, partial [Planctomycetota bacterium]
IYKSASTTAKEAARECANASVDEQLKSEFSHIDSEIKALEESSKLAKDTANSLIAEANQYIGKLESKVEQFDSILNEHQASVNKASASITSLNESQSIIETKLSAAMENLDKANESADNITNAISKKQNEIVDQLLTNTVFTSQIKDSISDKLTGMEKLESLIGEKLIPIETKQEELVEKISENAKLPIELQKKFDSQVAQLTGIQNKIKNLESPKKRTHYLSIPAAALIPRNKDIPYDTNGVFMYIRGDEAQVFHAPVILPHGAKVTKIVLNGIDGSGGRAGGYVKTSFHSYRQGSYNRIAAIGSTEAFDKGKFTETENLNATINNSAYSYGIQVAIANGDKGYGSAGFYNIEIEYEYF